METNRCGRTTALPLATSALDEEPSAALDATAEAVRVSDVSTPKEVNCLYFPVVVELKVFFLEIRHDLALLVANHHAH